MATRGEGAPVGRLEPDNVRNSSVSRDAAIGTSGVSGAPTGSSTTGVTPAAGRTSIADTSTAAGSTTAATTVVRSAVSAGDTSATTAGDTSATTAGDTSATTAGDTSATTAGDTSANVALRTASSTRDGKSPASGCSSGVVATSTAALVPSSRGISGQMRGGTSPGTGLDSGAVSAMYATGPSSRVISSPSQNGRRGRSARSGCRNELPSTRTATGPGNRVTGANAVRSTGAATEVGGPAPNASGWARRSAVASIRATASASTPPAATTVFDPSPVRGGPADISAGLAASTIHAVLASHAGSPLIPATGSTARSRGNTTRSPRSCPFSCST